MIDAVADDLRLRVINSGLAPGSALTENGVANTYGIARPTAKAAIERLVSEGVLVRNSHRTARVVQLGPEDVRDIYLTRAYLESEVLRRLACGRKVPERAVKANAEIRSRLGNASAQEIVAPDMLFHTALIDALDSHRTSHIYASLAFEVKLCMSQVQGLQLLSPYIIEAEHRRLLELLAAGEGGRAADLLDVHLARARELLVGALGGEAGPEATVPCDLL